jgi:hypothetical protein
MSAQHLKTCSNMVAQAFGESKNGLVISEASEKRFYGIRFCGDNSLKNNALKNLQIFCRLDVRQRNVLLMQGSL